MDNDDILITVQDLRTVRNGAKQGYCIPGLKTWAAQNGFCLKVVLRDGIRISQLSHFEDPFKDQIIATARKRVAGETP